MSDEKNSSTLPDEAVFGSAGKSWLNWLSQQESEMKDEGAELIKNGEVESGTNKILQSSGVSVIIELVEAMRRGLDDKEKNRPRKKTE